MGKKGITLIALIITVIVLLILAGVTLNLTLGERGIFNLAKQAGENYLNAQDKELADLDKLYGQIKVATGDTGEVTLNMEELNKIIEAKVNEKMNTLSKPKNPKKILEIQLAKDKGDTETHLASDELYFTQTTQEGYEKYLKQNSDKTWSVLQSGYYFIDSLCSCEGSSKKAYLVVRLLLNGDSKIAAPTYCGSSYGSYGCDANSYAIFIEESTVLDFSMEIVGDASGLWGEIKISPMF